MGLLATIRRNYRNAGANVWLSLRVVETYEDREHWKEPRLNWSCTGLEVHDHARSVKKGLLSILNEDAENYRKSIQIPQDYWRLAVRVIINNLKSYRDNPPREIFDLIRGCLCLVAETAFLEFKDGDSIAVVFTRDGETWVEVLSNGPKFALTSKCLGNVNK